VGVIRDRFIPLVRRTVTEDLDAVVMELFERIGDQP
jgi:hypothetical protein